MRILIKKYSADVGKFFGIFFNRGRRKLIFQKKKFLNIMYSSAFEFFKTSKIDIKQVNLKKNMVNVKVSSFVMTT